MNLMDCDGCEATADTIIGTGERQRQRERKANRERGVKNPNNRERLKGLYMGRCQSKK